MELKDSGARREFDSGAVRDIAEGKGRCDLLPLGVIGEILEDNILTLIEQYIRTGNKNTLISALLAFATKYTKGNWYDLFLDVAKQYEDGAKKYNDRNWEKGILFTVTSIAESDIISNSSGEMMTNRMVEPLYGTYLEHYGHRENKPEMIDLPFKED